MIASLFMIAVADVPLSRSEALVKGRLPTSNGKRSASARVRDNNSLWL